MAKCNWISDFSLIPFPVNNYKYHWLSLLFSHSMKDMIMLHLIIYLIVVPDIPTNRKDSIY